jgi:hypothetical protein
METTGTISVLRGTRDERVDPWLLEGVRDADALWELRGNG